MSFVGASRTVTLGDVVAILERLEQLRAAKQVGDQPSQPKPILGRWARFKVVIAQALAPDEFPTHVTINRPMPTLDAEEIKRAVLEVK